VPQSTDALKRLLIGRAMRSDRLHETLLPKRIALPVFASDALSSVAYAPDEVFLTLGIAGFAAYSFSWKVGLAVATVMLVVVASYRQNVHAYPSGGGDYEVATVNLGMTPGLTVASALLVDYVLTVAVSISSAAQYAASTIDSLSGHEVTIAVIAVALLSAANLRGVRESGTAFAIPTYAFMVAILGTAAWGFIRLATGGLPDVASARYELHAESNYSQGITGLAGAFLLLRAFSSGCAALTGVEAISNGVPAFRKPKSKNAATTLLLLGTIAVTMMLSIIVLAKQMGLRFAQDPVSQLELHGKLGRASGGGVLFPDGTRYDQDPVIGQIAKAIWDHAPILAGAVTTVTGLILVLAANTAFNGFPVLGSILAQDRYLPRQLHTRGDRLAYSNGILILASFAVMLIVAFDAQVTRLIQLYIVGVFVSFTLSQTGMVRHWTRLLRSETEPSRRRRMVRSRIINAVGLVVTGIVLVVVLVTKFAHGAWIAIAAMIVLFLLMKAIHRHYERVAAELVIDDSEDTLLPARTHAIVLVSKVHKPTMRAVNYARAMRPSTLEAVTVNVDPEETRALQLEWDRRNIPVPLKVLDSPFREVTDPVIDYVKSIRRGSPRDLVTVLIPEYVVGHWWEHLLHNQSALRLKGRLLFTAGVMVTSVPWQLESSAAREDRLEGTGSAAIRRAGMDRSGGDES
jgi:amino acid transporter